MITRVTITGADDSVQPKFLHDLQLEFPFVEWGILISKSSIGQNRFPSMQWLEVLTRFKTNAAPELKLSVHLCGRYVRQLLLGNTAVVHDLNDTTPIPIWPIFDRVQINTHGEKHSYNSGALRMLAEYHHDKEFIFQYDKVNTPMLIEAFEVGVNCSALFDLSHGAGVLPTDWPEPLGPICCGYAGGLSPENLEDQIKRIEEKAVDTPIWIDMETHVRSNNDRLFDLAKVRRCLEIAQNYVKQPA